MSIRKAATAALFGTALTLASASQAATLFQDSFDSDSGSSTLNFNSLTNWTVSDGTIDYIRSGGYSITCSGGAGGCLDMDGSTSNAGRITSTATYSLTAGVTYTLSGLISGNQRGGAADALTMGVLDAGTGTSLTSFTWASIAAGASFSTQSLVFTVATNQTVRLFFEGLGGDDLGPILDNVLFVDDGGSTTVSEPGTLLLAGVGLMLAALGRRRARSQDPYPGRGSSPAR